MAVETVEMPGASVEVSLRLEAARQRKGFKSWAEVARRCGLRPTSLSHLVAGKVRLADVRLGTLVKLCSVLDVGLDELVSVETASRAPRPRADRPITREEFALAVRALLESPPPADWIGPTEEDLEEAAPSRFVERLRQQQAGLEDAAEPDS